MGASLLALMILSLLLGLCLTGYNVLAVLVAIAIVVGGSLIVDLVRDAPLAHYLLASAVAAVFVPAGYLVGQLLRWSRK